MKMDHPNIIKLYEVFESKNWLRPKSAILMGLSSSSPAFKYNKFSGFKSLCTIPLLWQYSIAPITCWIILQASFSV